MTKKFTFKMIVLLAIFFCMGAAVTAFILKKKPEPPISNEKMQELLRNNVWPLAESVRLRERISNSKKNKLVLLGDSITEWGHWEGWLEEYQLLNFGVGGNKTSDILKRLSDVEDQKPTLVFLMAGINDIFAETDKKETLHNYEQIVKTLKATGAKVVCASVLPISTQNSRYAQTNDSVQYLNREIEAITKRNAVEYFDLTKELVAPEIFALSNEYTVDSVHLNSLAYAKWMLRLNDYLSRSKM